MAPEMRDNDVPTFHLLSQTVNWHLRPDSFYIVFFAKAPAERYTISGGSFKQKSEHLLCWTFKNQLHNYCNEIAYFEDLLSSFSSSLKSISYRFSRNSKTDTIPLPINK